LDRPRLPLIYRLAQFAQTERGRRAIGVTAALAIEAVLLLMLLAMGIRDEPDPVPMAEVSTFDVADPAAPDAPPEAEPEDMPSALEPEPRPVEQPEPRPSAAPEPAPLPPAAVIPRPVPAAPAARPASAANAPVYGPPAPANRPRDSARVGTAPNGQPLYAAAWHRRPRDDEMRGYLSTAEPGYAQIACRTVPDFRVEDCVLEAEYPPGSQMGRAVLGMAWQFRVRPPMLGGRYQVGEWVRIRITYTVQERFEF
jgi:protein TonB